MSGKKLDDDERPNVSHLGIQLTFLILLLPLDELVAKVFGKSDGMVSMVGFWG